MSSSDRRTLLSLLAGLPLAACGFSPVHAPGAPANALFGTIRADDPEDRLGYLFIGRVEQRFGRPETPRWALGYRIGVGAEATGFSPDDRITRYHLPGSLDWSLRPVGGGDPVLTGTERNFTAYSATGTTVATLAARRDAEARLVTILADQMATVLIARAGTLAP